MDSTALKAEGWWRLPTDKFSAAIGPVWARGDAGERVLGLMASETVANENIGIVHGGALMTFVDIAFGFAASDALGGGGHCATVQLQYHFAGAVRMGSFVICRPELVRRTSQLVFIRGLIEADGKVVGSADGVFKALESGQMERMRTR